MSIFGKIIDKSYERTHQKPKEAQELLCRLDVYIILKFKKSDVSMFNFLTGQLHFMAVSWGQTTVLEGEFLYSAGRGRGDMCPWCPKGAVAGFAPRTWLNHRDHLKAY